jgi:hypothetical protein
LILVSCSSAPETFEYDPAYVEHTTVAELQVDATSIITGEIVDQRSEWINVAGEPANPDDPNQNPNIGQDGQQPNSLFLYTVYSLRVETVIQGTREVGDTVEIRQLGGKVGDQRAVASGAAELTFGDSYVVFLVDMPDGMAEFPNPTDSVFPLTDDGVVSAAADNPLGARGAADVERLVSQALAR